MSLTMVNKDKQIDNYTDAVLLANAIVKRPNRFLSAPIVFMSALGWGSELIEAEEYRGESDIVSDGVENS